MNDNLWAYVLELDRLFYSKGLVQVPVYKNKKEKSQQTANPMNSLGVRIGCVLFGEIPPQVENNNKKKVIKEVSKKYSSKVLKNKEQKEAMADYEDFMKEEFDKKMIAKYFVKAMKAGLFKDKDTGKALNDNAFLWHDFKLGTFVYRVIRKKYERVKKPVPPVPASVQMGERIPGGMPNNKLPGKIDDKYFE